MPRENRSYYSCVPLGIAMSTLYKSFCEAAYCSDDVYVFSVHFCEVVLVMFCDLTDVRCEGEMDLHQILL
jgi:hypothetical protein